MSRRPRGEDGMMTFYLLVAMVGLLLGALLVPLIVSSSRATNSDTSRQHAIDAARAGVNVMLGQIRAATDDDGSAGDTAALPCGSVSGTVNTGQRATYTVTVAYYVDDPVTTSGATKMACLSGYGTYLNGTYTPRFARITAYGYDGTAANGSTPGRKLISTYTLESTNVNISGGQIQIFPASGVTTKYCMDAGASVPSSKTVATLQTCAQPATQRQIFAYRSDLTLQLLSSVTTSNPNGMCLDTADAPTNGNTIYLYQCNALGSPPYTQQWSFNDNGGFTASTATATSTGTLSTQCIGVANASVGYNLTLANCSAGGVTSSTQAWIPARTVGSGAAPAAAGTQRQLVNYYEFGRCLDVTGQNVGATHLIDYPCKQNPNPNSVAWNQKFYAPTPGSSDTYKSGQIYTVTNSKNYCLTSPGTSGGYVTVAVCSASNTNQTWKVYSGISTSTYTAKYQIVDSGGRCLGLTDPASGEQWSAIDVEACTGATEQKWNADAGLTSSSLSGTTETAP